MKEWHARKDRLFKSARGRWWPWIGGGAVLLACLPLDGHVSAVAVLAPIDAQPIVAGDPAKVETISVRNGQSVKAGDIIAELSAPEIATFSQQKAARIRQLEEQLGRGAADQADLANRSILERELASEKAAALGAERRRTRLLLRSPVDGIVTDLGPDIHVGRWLSGSEVVARIVSPGRYDIQAYIEEDDVWRVQSAAMARFIPDDLAHPSRPAKLVEAASAAMELIDQPILASTNGGPIAANEDRQKRLKPRDALYRFRFVAPVDRTARNILVQPITGRLQIDAERTSLIGGLLRSIARIWRSESSLS
jgi:putative peptide zinc metalloprotease protein